MPLGPGTRLGPYEILSALGAGGMGEVYRARDTKLDRDVAIKVLPEVFAAEPERIARFQREAKTLAALNHPHIAAIYGIEESDGTHALVMELVEGEDLSQRISRGPVPLDEALPIAKQIAEALEAAHEQGIIHRDLKPANIKVRPDGTVKVLDFGLAKLHDSNAPNGPNVPNAMSMSPTITSPAMMTSVGVLLGTAPYMSPEQARGKAIDKRADIWAFGCLLYEMLTGKRAFDDEDVSMTLSKILQREPDFDALPPTVPARVRQALRVCLRKDSKQRMGDIRDVRLALEGAFETVLTPGTAAVAATSPAGWRRGLVLFGIFVIGGSVVGGAVWFATRPTPPRVVRTEIATAGATALSISGGDRDIAITPDGSRIVYRGQNELLVRSLDQLVPTALTGLGTPRGVFISPDGQWVGFFDGNGLKKVAITGGPPVTLTTGVIGQNSRGATWSEGGAIIFATSAIGTGLQRVSESGGEPTVLTKPNRERGEDDHVWPEFLPGGQAVLFTITATVGGLNNAQIAVLDLRTNRQTVLVRGGHHAHYVPSGHLVYGTGGTLRAVAFDLARLTVTGTAVPVLEQVATTAGGGVNAVVAGNGTLVYATATAVVGVGDGLRSLVWVDRTGREEALRLLPADYGWARVSPDGLRVATSFAGPEGQQDVWVSELARGTLSRVTTDQQTDNDPVWTPDGRRLVFASQRGRDRFGFYSVAADGTGPVDLLLMSETAGFFRPYGWSPDGKSLVFDYGGVDGRGNIGMLSMESTRPWKPLLQTEANEVSPTLSPDGAWIAYSSNRTGRPEVYVERFPDLGDRKQISTDGGAEPLWSRDGHELLYRRGNAMIAVPLDSKPTLSVGSPRVLFEAAYFATDGSRRWDLSPDGKRFLMIKQNGGDIASRPQNLVVAQHFDEELKRLVPTK